MKKVIEYLNEFFENSKVSASALARAIGVSPGAISQFRKGEYKGDNAALSEKIVSYINNYNEKTKDSKKALKR